MSILATSNLNSSSHCVICLNEYDKVEEERIRSSVVSRFISLKKITTTPCHHRFHHSCISSWLRRNPTCPICRTDLAKLQPIHLRLDRFIETNRDYFLGFSLLVMPTLVVLSEDIERSLSNYLSNRPYSDLLSSDLIQHLLLNIVTLFGLVVLGSMAAEPTGRFASIYLQSYFEDLIP